jgi:hypothetical protein
MVVNIYIYQLSSNSIIPLILITNSPIDTHTIFNSLLIYPFYPIASPWPGL